MKPKKLVTVMLVLGTLLLALFTVVPPGVNAAPQPPTNTGDIILTDSGYIPGVSGWDHAALYIGSGNIMEADPHCEDWGWLEWWWSTGQYEKLWRGGVEEDTLSQTFQDYDTVAYLEVTSADGDDRVEAVQFTIGQEGEAFDYISYWDDDAKQVDANGFYCSELVWAAYYHYPLRINLDSSGSGGDNAVSPQEIDDHPDTDKYLGDEPAN